jgi:carboxyl-terminal processing protease
MSRLNPSRFPNRNGYITLVLIIALLLLLFQQVASKNKVDSTEKRSEEFARFADLFCELQKKIQDKYVRDVDPKDLYQAAINGMFRALDAHSQFLDPDSLSQLEKETEGEFSGIGIHITLRDNILTVIAPIPGSPAAQLGIRSWDRIIEIDKKSTEGITLPEAVKKLTGPPGTTVTVTIYRRGTPEPLHFTITRASIRIKSVYYKIIDDIIGYVRIARFSDNTGDDLRKVVRKMKRKNIKGIILDLRWNSGGLLKEAVDAANLFVPKGMNIVSTKGRLESQNRVYTAKSDPELELPILVLVNHGSASASEILAGAIQDLQLGLIMAPQGQRTFGKGSVQTIEELENSLETDEHGNLERCAIRLTTAEYYTPSGRSIQPDGIKPDIEVPVSDEEEALLLQHGLLGDPSLLEPDENLPEKKIEPEKEKQKDVEPQGQLEEKKDEKEKQATPFFAIEKEEKKKEKKKKVEFVDSLLDEAVKKLKFFIQMKALEPGKKFAKEKS